MRDIRSTWFSLFIRKIPLLLLFYSPKFLEALLGIVLRNLLVMLFHTWFPQKTIRSETKLVLLTAKKISWQRLVNRAKQWICKNIWLITTSVDTLMIVVIYNVTGWRRIYICQGGFLGKVKWVDRILPSFLYHFYCSKTTTTNQYYRNNVWF